MPLWVGFFFKKKAKLPKQAEDEETRLLFNIALCVGPASHAVTQVFASVLVYGPCDMRHLTVVR